MVILFPLVAQKLSADFARVLAGADIKARVEDLGMDVVASSLEQFDAFIQSEMKKWAAVVSEAKIEAN